jgi:hypothetical protein
MIGVGQTPGCFQGADPTPYLRIYSASIMRVIVNPGTGADGSALGCVQAAATEGYHVDLTIQLWNWMSVNQDAGEFRSMLAMYGPYVWAVAVGNEQELNQGGASEGGARYAAIWKAVEADHRHDCRHTQSAWPAKYHPGASRSSLRPSGAVYRAFNRSARIRMERERRNASRVLSLRCRVARADVVHGGARGTRLVGWDGGHLVAADGGGCCRRGVASVGVPNIVEEFGGGEPSGGASVEQTLPGSLFARCRPRARGN